MRSVLRSRLLLLMTVPLAAVAAACSSSSGTAGTSPATLITVAPSSVAGNLTCTPFDGAWRSYVVTITDITDPNNPFQLASSGPVPCSVPVSFAFVVPGHYYVAQVDGYDRADIAPYGGASSGSPHMIDPATGADVAPRWTTNCGDLQAVIQGLSDLPDAGNEADADSDASSTEPFMDHSTLCSVSTNVMMQHCAAFPAQPGGDTSIVVDMASLRGSLSCGTDVGQLAHLNVLPADPSLPEQDNVACDATATFSGLTPNVDYQFRVEAFENNATSPSWATSCHAVARDGVVMPAQCAPLSDKGSIVVDIASLLAGSNHTCTADDIVTYSAVLLGSEQQPTEPDCSVDTEFNDLSPATYQVLVDAFDSSHKQVFTAFCDAPVKPGRSTVPTCTFSPAP